MSPDIPTYIPTEHPGVFIDNTSSFTQITNIAHPYIERQQAVLVRTPHGLEDPNIELHQREAIIIGERLGIFSEP